MSGLVQTLVYLGLMVAGIVVGVLVRKREKLVRSMDTLAIVTICVLAFVLGAGIGASEKVRSQLASVGTAAACLAVATMAGSVLASWVVYRLWFRRLDP